MFIISPLPLAPFRPLLDLPDAELAQRLARRAVADSDSGFPCRVSLVDARRGEGLILVHYEHQPAASPFRASHAIYVRAAAEETKPQAGEIPEQLRSRTLSLRGFDAGGMMVAAELVEGRAADAPLEALLATSGVDYVHIHFAKFGCYAARADRA